MFNVIQRKFRKRTLESLRKKSEEMRKYDSVTLDLRKIKSVTLLILYHQMTTNNAGYERLREIVRLNNIKLKTYVFFNNDTRLEDNVLGTSFSKNDFTFMGKPKSEAVKSIINKEADLYIDMTGIVEYPNIYLSLFVKAPLRTSMVDNPEMCNNIMFLGVNGKTQGDKDFVNSLFINLERFKTSRLE